MVQVMQPTSKSTMEHFDCPHTQPQSTMEHSDWSRSCNLNQTMEHSDWSSSWNLNQTMEHLIGPDHAASSPQEILTEEIR